MTPAEYAANVQARFPKCFTAEGLANPAALAKRESAARLRAVGKSPHIMHNPTGTTTRTPQSEARRIARLQETLAAKSSRTRQRIWDALAEPKTINDLAHEVCLSRFTIHNNLAEMLEQQKIRRTFVKKTAIWERAE